MAVGNVTGSTYSYSTLKQDGGKTEAKDLAAKLEQALKNNDQAALKALAPQAEELLTDLENISDDITTQITTGGVLGAEASKLADQLATVQQSLTELEGAVSDIGAQSPGAGLPTGSSENVGAPKFSLGIQTGDGKTTKIPVKAADVAKMLRQTDPDNPSSGSLAASLKKQVKDGNNETPLERLLDMMMGDDGSDDKSSKGSKGGKGGKSAKGGTGGGNNAGNVPGGTGGDSPGGVDTGLTFGETTSHDPVGDIGGVDSNITLTKGQGTESGSGNTADLDANDVKLGLVNPGNINEFLMIVLLAGYESGQEGLEMMAKNLQKQNKVKEGLRDKLAGLYKQKSSNEKLNTAVDAQIQNVQGQLSSASDDAQMQQLQLQNATQNQQQLLQEISSFSKNLYDASMNILRKIGS